MVAVVVVVVVVGVCGQPYRITKINRGARGGLDS